jgi:HTH-type transcriptional regulator/antitoxin HigA
MTDRDIAETFPPGEFLSDELDARGWTQTEFAQIIGRPIRVINEIIAAKRGITPETARDFAAALGTTAQLWMNLETAYQLSKVPPRAATVTREATLRERFPVREMLKRGWIKAANTYPELESSVLSYFELRTLDDAIEFPHAARRNYGHDLSSIQYAWLFRVRQLALALRVSTFSQDKLRNAIPELERLMVEPEEIRHVPKILFDVGVRLVIVEPIPGSKIQGVCFWVNDNTSPVIGLSLKSDFIDKFWFTLWHELSHVQHEDGKQEMVIDDFDEPPPDGDESERIANIDATNRCVPSRAMKDFILRHNPMFSEKSMIGFSRIVKRHPGIVAGQIQRATDRYDLFKKHQPRIRSILIQTAATDGYGRTTSVDL